MHKYPWLEEEEVSYILLVDHEKCPWMRRVEEYMGIYLEYKYTKNRLTLAIQDISIVEIVYVLIWLYNEDEHLVCKLPYLKVIIT